MAGITLTIAQTHLDAALAAHLRVLDSQAYSIAGRSQQRAMLGDIQKDIAMWDGEVKRLTRGGIRVRGATPV